MAISQKTLLPYLQRAQEMQKFDPLVAYYCRLYALEKGLSVEQRSPDFTDLLKTIMQQLEKDKPAAGLSSQEDDQLHIEGFAQQIFSKADTVDRAGKATVATARSFYAAKIFLDVLQVFGDVSSDMEQQAKYAAWKAAEIQKAIREGRKPMPGPPAEESGIAPADAIFSPGQRVLCMSETEGIVDGTVVRQDGIGPPRTYLVGLKAEAKSLDAELLAPRFEPGDEILYWRRGESQKATLLAMDMTHWRPSYTIEVDGCEINTVGERLSIAVDVQENVCPPPNIPVEKSSTPPPPAPAAEPPSSQVSEIKPANSQTAEPVEGAAPAKGASYPSLSPPVPEATTQPYVPQASASASAFKPTTVMISDAQKYSRYAVSALGFSDVKTAVDNLQKALDLLTRGT